MSVDGILNDNHDSISPQQIWHMYDMSLLTLSISSDVLCAHFQIHTDIALINQHWKFSWYICAVQLTHLDKMSQKKAPFYVFPLSIRQMTCVSVHIRHGFVFPFSVHICCCFSCTTVQICCYVTYWRAVILELLQTFTNIKPMGGMLLSNPLVACVHRIWSMTLTYLIRLGMCTYTVMQFDSFEGR